jgi:putative pyruvate formate lyase activating enzyme
MGNATEKCARLRLPGYYSILDGKRSARYLDCKKILISADLKAETGSLWRIHNQVVGSTLKFESVPAEKAVSLLDLKTELARRMLAGCAMCERKCGADRSLGKKGACGVLGPKIASEFMHWGEEPELVPSYTIFFSGCTFRCAFCQNWDISQSPDAGAAFSPETVGEWIERRQGRNVNWVGGEPTPNLAFILQVLGRAGKNIPQIWNSNMYMSEKTMALLDGVIDLYLADFKYGNSGCAERLSDVKGYWEAATRNHATANRQCEMLIRHLVMPGHLECCTMPVLRWISDTLDTNKVRVNVMDQYRPVYRAGEHADIDRRLKPKEFRKAVNYADELGLDLVE